MNSPKGNQGRFIVWVRRVTLVRKSQGIRFNVVAPGLVKTKLTRRIWKSERAEASSRSMHALGRLGTSEEVASLVAWLLQPTNSWVTGEVFSIDGGLANIHLQSRPASS